MSEIKEYKCPACGGAMEFDSKSQKMKSDSRRSCKKMRFCSIFYKNNFWETQILLVSRETFCWRRL